MDNVTKAIGLSIEKALWQSDNHFVDMLSDHIADVIISNSINKGKNPPDKWVAKRYVKYQMTGEFNYIEQES